MRLTPLGLCLRFIVNEKPLNLEKTTCSVLSVLLLIYDQDNHIFDVLPISTGINLGHFFYKKESRPVGFGNLSLDKKHNEKSIMDYQWKGSLYRC